MFAFVAREPCKEGRDGPADPGGGGKIEKATATEDNDGGGGVACIFKTNSALAHFPRLTLSLPNLTILTWQKVNGNSGRVEDRGV